MRGVATLKGPQWWPFGRSVDLYGFDFRSDPEHKFINGLRVGPYGMLRCNDQGFVEKQALWV